MATTTFSHPSIGNINASTSKEGVLQFLGVQYATLADRFAEPKIKEYKQDETIDATKLGPQVVSLAPNADGEFMLLQHGLEYDRSAFTQSDTEGLCLNITVPSGAQDGSRKLPVLVFIHGGGFNVGSGMYPQYDMARFVRLSVAEGKECIGVSMNYRLGGAGFLTSAPLRAAGYKPNNGLRDQRAALLWLQKYISGFGGDPSNITLMGESAGGISACYHLFSPEPLFKRMVSMSGTTPLMPPSSPETAEKNYQSAIKALALEESEAVEKLVKMDGQELVQKLAGAGTSWTPVLDGEICPTEFDFESFANDKVSIPGHEWCEAAIIGDCQFDGSIQALQLMGRKKGISHAFQSTLRANLSSHPGLADKILNAYDITPETGDERAFVKILEVANDLKFYLPTLALAENLSRHDVKTYMYRFNEPNPWEGPWKGQATHILDITFLLQNFNEFLGESTQRLTAEQFGRDVVAFVNGEEPWKPWRAAKVLGPRGAVEVVEEDKAVKVGRRSVMVELGEEVGVDVLRRAFDGFVNAPPPV